MDGAGHLGRRRNLGGAAFTVEHPPGDAPGAVVRFGDGNSRPPTGRDNVAATYRCGLGSDGAVPPGA
ncbi:hypothetical protein ACFQ0M_10230 [Kitasatospora aburaviensis]